MDQQETMSLSLLLSQGHNPNEKDSTGLPLLHKAAKMGRKEMVKLLLDANADVEVVDSDGWTALHRAAEAGCEECVGLLLGCGRGHASGMGFRN